MYIGRFNTKFLSIYRNYSLHSWYFLIKLKKNPNSTFANKFVGDHALHAYMYVKNTLNYISWRSLL